MKKLPSDSLGNMGWHVQLARCTENWALVSQWTWNRSRFVIRCIWAADAKVVKFKCVLLDAASIPELNMIVG